VWYQEVAEQWGLQFMPTFMLFKHGKKVYTLICFMSSMLNACDYRWPLFADRFIRFSTICLYQRVTDGQNWYCTLPSCCARLMGQKGQSLWWLEETARVAVSAVATIGAYHAACPRQRRPRKHWLPEFHKRKPVRVVDFHHYIIMLMKTK